MPINSTAIIAPAAQAVTATGVGHKAFAASNSRLIACQNGTKSRRL